MSKTPAKRERKYPPLTLSTTIARWVHAIGVVLHAAKDDREGYYSASELMQAVWLWPYKGQWYTVAFDNYRIAVFRIGIAVTGRPSAVALTHHAAKTLLDTLKREKQPQAE